MSPGSRWNPIRTTRPALRPGAPAPDFLLPAFAPLTGTPQGEVRLAALRGRPVLLVFLRWLG